jgi:hypothetical protein
MQLDGLQYLLTRLSPKNRNKDYNGKGKEKPLGTLDRAVILERLTSVPGFELLCRISRFKPRNWAIWERR